MARSLAAPWRAALRLALRDASRNRAATALIAAAVVLVVAGATAGDVLLRSITPPAAVLNRMILGDSAQARITWHLPGPVQQTPRDDLMVGGADAEPPSPGEYEATLLDLLPEGSDLIRAVTGTVTARTGDRATEGLEALEAPVDGPLADAFAPVEGTAPTAPGEALVSRELARRLSLEPGEEVELAEDGGDARTVTVTGVASASRNPAQVVLAPGTLLDTGGELGTATAASVWFVTGPAPVTWDRVLRINETGSTVYSRAVVSDPPPPAEVPLLGEQPTAGPDTRLLFLGGLAAGTVLACLVTGPAFAVRARRAERDLALVSAQGGDERTLRRTVLLGAAAVGGGAGAVGTLAGLGASWAVSAGLRHIGDPIFPALVLPAADLAAFWALGVLTALTAALPPALRAGRTDPVAVLSGRPAPVTRRRRAGVASVTALSAAVLVVTAFRTATPWLFVPAALVATGAVVLGTPLVVNALARLAGRLPLAGRIALRDAARNGERTAMAATVTVAAVAALVAVAVFTSSAIAHEGRRHFPRAALGTALVYLPDDASASTADEAEAVLREQFPESDVVPVRMIAPRTEVAPVPDPGQPCPDWAVWPPQEVRTEPITEPVPLESPDCAPMKANGDQNRQVMWGGALGAAPLVDDGTLVRALGLPGAQEAAEALAEGRAVVTRDLDLWPDGHARVEFRRARGEPASAGEEEPFEDGRRVRVPATVVEWPSAQYGLIVPPKTLAEWGGEAVTVGLVAGNGPAPSREREDRARAAVAEAAGAELFVERPYSSPRTRQMYVLLALAGAVAVGSCLVAVRLATLDSRRDAATLLVVGADPRTGRRIAGARAATTAGIGVLLGGVSGLAVGAAAVMAEAHFFGYFNPAWSIVVPWPLLTACLTSVIVLATLLATVPSPSRTHRERLMIP